MATKKDASTAAETKEAVAAESKTVSVPTAVLAQPPKAAEAKAEVKAEAKTESKTETKQTAAKKPAAKSKASTTKKPKSETKGEMKVDLVFQYMGREISQTGMIDAVKNAWSSEGKDPAGIESLELYVKPEDSAIYYVVNGTEHGKFDF